MSSETITERYSRQIRFKPIGTAGQNKLSSARVLIVGMGALGTVLANHMVRSGIGMLRIVDRDYVEMSNLQRQMLYDEDDALNVFPKAIAAERKLRRINSDVRIEAIVADVTPLNAETLLEHIDLVLDGTDNFQTRLLMNDACFKSGIPFVYGGVVSSQGMSAVFVPGATCCFRCLIGSDGSGGGQTCDTVGVISPIVDIIASFQAVEALKYLVGDHGNLRNSLLSVEVWNHRLFDMKLPGLRSECPTCGRKQYPSLDQGETMTAVLCGRDTVQMRYPEPMDLHLWQSRLAVTCRIYSNPFLLKAQLPEGETLVLFPDGRVLVQGTEDIVRARTLFDRYIGS